MEFQFSRVNRSLTYWTVLGLFAAANAWSWARHHIGEPVCCDQLVASGFPFPFHVSGGIAGINDFLVTGLLLDIVTAWTLALTGAWIALSLDRHKRNASSPSAADE